MERKTLTYQEVLDEATSLANKIKGVLEGIQGLRVDLELVRPPYDVGKLYKDLRGVVAGKVWPILVFNIDGIPSNIHLETGVPERGVVFDLLHRASKDHVCAKVKFGMFVRSTPIANPGIIRENVEASVAKFREYGERAQVATKARHDALDRARATFGVQFQHVIQKVSQGVNYIEGTSTNPFDPTLSITWAYLRENAPQERLRVISTTGTLLEDVRSEYIAARRSLEAEYITMIVRALSPEGA